MSCGGPCSWGPAGVARCLVGELVVGGEGGL